MALGWRIELQIEPDSFGAAVELVRIFDRVNAR